MLGLMNLILFLETPVLDEKIEQVRNSRRLVCMRYWNEVYVDLAIYEKLRKGGSVEQGLENSNVPGYF